MAAPATQSSPAARHERNKTTASTYRSLRVQGTHRFHIHGYSDLKAAAGYYDHTIASAAFHVTGHHWAIRCRFHRHHLESVSLQREELPPGAADDKEVKAMVTFTIEDPAGEPLAFHDDDMEARYVKGDRLTVCCTLRVLLLPQVTTTSRNCFPAAPPPPSISRSLADLLETGQGSDVTFQVEDRELKAHKFVLAMRSPVFKAKFFGDTMDSSQHVVRIDDMSAAVFTAMLRFVYTDDVDDLCMDMEDDDMVYDLLVAADLYDLRRLRVMCEKRLSEGIDGAPAAMSMLALVHRRHNCRQLEDLRARIAGDLLAAADRFQLLERMMPMCENLLCDVITPGTAADTLALAERHRRPELKAFCLDYIASSPDVLKTVVRTQVYKDLKASSDGGQALGDIIERMLAVNFS
ncbi:hypothetical protein ACP70R_045621 [Stipagrostis hirtigluma subsp. patula]